VAPMPRYWVSELATDTGKVDKHGDPIMEPGVQTRLEAAGWDRGWLLGWRDICRATDERTSVVGFSPKAAIGHKYLLELVFAGPREISVLASCQVSFCFDYLSRQKIGGTSMSFFVWRQLPVISR